MKNNKKKFKKYHVPDKGRQRIPGKNSPRGPRKLAEDIVENCEDMGVVLECCVGGAG